MKNKKCIAAFLLFSISAYAFAVSSKKSVSYGRHGMVVSSQHLATKVGVNVLKKGGNAIDAAVAMGYALAVVHPCCGNLGGGGFMTIHLANGQSTVINFREKVPVGFYSEKLKQSAYANVGVPGTVKGLNAALNRYGTKPLNQIMRPAIRLAERGFILQPQDVQFLLFGKSDFRKQANTARIFLKQGRPYRVKERLVQKNLANTLKLIARQGDSAFYQGAIADAIVRESRRKGGALQKSDFANYQVTFEKPLYCSYRGYRVMTTPAPSLGGRRLCQLLEVMNDFPLSHYGYGSLNSLAANLEAIKYVYQHKKTSGFSAKNLLQIFKNGSFNHGANKLNKKARVDTFNTTSYMVADFKGNQVMVTYTLNGPFGSKVIAGDTGFFLNNELKDLKEFGGASSKRPLSYITQVLLFKNRSPFLMLASPGGETIPTQMLIMLENMIDYKMDLQSAMNAPRYHYYWQKGTVHLEPEWKKLGKKTLLESVGYHIGTGSGSELALPYWGGMTGIMFDSQKRRFEGAVDKRRPTGLAKGF